MESLPRAGIRGCSAAVSRLCGAAGVAEATSEAGHSRVTLVTETAITSGAARSRVVTAALRAPGGPAHPSQGAPFGLARGWPCRAWPDTRGREPRPGHQHCPWSTLALQGRCALEMNRFFSVSQDEVSASSGRRDAEEGISRATTRPLVRRPTCGAVGGAGAAGQPTSGRGAATADATGWGGTVLGAEWPERGGAGLAGSFMRGGAGRGTEQENMKI